jgi:hypothetical protein
MASLHSKELHIITSRNSKYNSQEPFYTLAEREKPSGTHFTLGPQPVEDRNQQVPSYIGPTQNYAPTIPATSVPTQIVVS